MKRVWKESCKKTERNTVNRMRVMPEARSESITVLQDLANRRRFVALHFLLNFDYNVETLVLRQDADFIATAVVAWMCRRRTYYIPGSRRVVLGFKSCLAKEGAVDIDGGARLYHIRISYRQNSGRRRAARSDAKSSFRAGGRLRSLTVGKSGHMKGIKSQFSSSSTGREGND